MTIFGECKPQLLAHSSRNVWYVEMYGSETVHRQWPASGNTNAGAVRKYRTTKPTLFWPLFGECYILSVCVLVSCCCGG